MESNVKYSLSYLGLFLCHFMSLTWADPCVPELLRQGRGFLVSVPNQQAVMMALAAEGASDAAGSTSPLPLLANLTLDEFLEGGQLIAQPEGPQGLSSFWESLKFILFLSSLTTSPSLEFIFFLGNLKLIWGKPITYGPVWSVGKSSARGQGIKLLGRTGPLAHWVVLGKSPPLYGP